MAEGYDRTVGSRLRAVLLAVWVIATDLALHIVARVGGCAGVEQIDAKLLRGLFDAPGACAGTPMAGEAIVLVPRRHDGALFGLGPGVFVGFVGQVYALGLLLLATIMTIVVVRWDSRSAGDGMILGLAWGGALAGALPRLVGDGRGSAELDLFGLHTGIAELALLWSLVWLVVRLVAESRP